MGIKVMSWNAQGGSDRKLPEALECFCKIYGAPDIIFLQEGGTYDSKNPTGFIEGKKVVVNVRGKTITYQCIIVEEDPTAKVHRCTLACLVQVGYVHNIAKVVIKGYHGVSRPIICVVFGGILLGSIHAVASSKESVAEVKDAIKSIIDCCKKYKKDGLDENCWILIGDMNSEPKDYNDNVKVDGNKLTEIRYGSDWNKIVCNILCSGNPTQGAGGLRDKELDFSFLGTSLKQTQYKSYQNLLPKDSNDEVLSDHNMIACTIEMK